MAMVEIVDDPSELHAEREIPNQIFATHIELHQFPNKAVDRQCSAFALYFFWFATDHADAADASARYLFITCCIPRK